MNDTPPGLIPGTDSYVAYGFAAEFAGERLFAGGKPPPPSSLWDHTAAATPLSVTAAAGELSP